MHSNHSTLLRFANSRKNSFEYFDNTLSSLKRKYLISDKKTLHSHYLRKLEKLLQIGIDPWLTFPEAHRKVSGTGCRQNSFVYFKSFLSGECARFSCEYCHDSITDYSHFRDSHQFIQKNSFDNCIVSICNWNKETILYNSWKIWVQILIMKTYHVEQLLQHWIWDRF